MLTPESYINERLDHLGLMAGVCQEMGLSAYLDRLAGERKQQVSVGTATVAMILNGLGFSNRRLYLVPQFSPTNRLSICWVQASKPMISTMTAWDERSNGCTLTIPRSCSQALP